MITPKIESPINPTDVAFSPAVKRVQARKGSRAGYEHMRMSDTISNDLVQFIAERDSFYMATANAEGQPYIQHRGGPKGFLKVQDEKTLLFADYKGNRQFISTGNLEDNNKVYLFMMDYANQQRIKIWGTAEIIEGNDGLLNSLMPSGYRAKGEQVIRINVNAWDVNCPQHIPQKFAAEDVDLALSTRNTRILDLETEVLDLRSELRSLKASAPKKG